MRSRIHAVVLPSEVGEFADEVRKIFQELGSFGGTSIEECSPPLDVHETDEAMAITVDLPGVEASAIRLIVKGQALLIAGEKAQRRGRANSSFHLVERGYGRFARSVRLTIPCDTGRAHATLARGELRITLPKIAERRGRPISIPVGN